MIELRVFAEGMTKATEAPTDMEKVINSLLDECWIFIHHFTRDFEVFKTAKRLYAIHCFYWNFF